MNIDALRKEIKELGSSEKASASARFFKTKEGEYGYGDVFLGLTVPQSRLIAKKYYDLERAELLQLLHSPIHEERLISLIIFIYQYIKGTEQTKKEIYDIYLENTKWINNWDLIDLSAEYIVGDYLLVHCHSRESGNLLDKIPDTQEYDFTSESKTRINRQVRNDKSIDVLSKLAHSDSVWERRISILSTFAFIKHGEYELTFHIADILLHDTHDLIQKAVGWLLREVGKRVSEKAEKEFLKTRYKTMPRTMLRYAIERFPEEERKAYLLGDI